MSTSVCLYVCLSDSEHQNHTSVRPSIDRLSHTQRCSTKTSIITKQRCSGSARHSNAITYFIESYTIIISLQSYFYYWYSITHSLFHSRLKSFLFCESSLPQLFLSLLQDSLYGFPRLFTATSEHIRLFYFLVFFLFLHFFSCRFRAVD